MSKRTKETKRKKKFLFSVTPFDPIKLHTLNKTNAL